MTKLELPKTASKFVSDEIVTNVLCVLAKEELIDLVNNYKSRKYDEEIRCLESL